VRAAGWVALAALAVTIASLGYLHVAPTGLSPVHNAVSQYGITPYRAGYRVATIAFGVAGAALALGLHDALTSVAFVVVLLVVFAVARGLISWFPMDAPGSGPTSTGRTHGLLALLAFGSATIAALRLSHVLARNSIWHGLEPVSTALGAAMAVCLLGLGFAGSSPAVRGRFGAIERGFYVSAIAWFAVFSFACATR